MTTQEDREAARSLNEHPCWSVGLCRLSHRHWWQDDQLMPTCERCGTPIDREHNETGSICWTPPKRKPIVTMQDQKRIADAAMLALGEWLSWPDAARDGPREVTVDQTVSFLGGLPQALATRHREASTAALQAEVARLWGAVTTIIGRCEALEDEALDGMASDCDAKQRGFWSGQKITAKSLRRNLADMTRAALTTPTVQGERRWSCECGWSTSSTADEVAIHGAPTECSKCFKGDPSETTLATPPAPDAGVREALDETALYSIYNVLHCIYDTCEDEGDRIYLGSTNDHHTLKRQLERLEKMIPREVMYPPEVLAARNHGGGK